MKSGGVRDRFINFTMNNVPSIGKSEEQRNLVRRLLEQAYDYRSAFTHGGSAIPDACLLADKAGYGHIKHYVDEKEALSPGLGWLEKMVRSALLGFLGMQEVAKEPTDRFSELAQKQGIIVLKAKRPIEAGRVVTGGDVELQ